jgi:hypothetical protein
VVYRPYTTIKYVVIGAIIATLLGSNLSLDLAFASSGRDLSEEERESGFYNENDYLKSQSQSQRSPVNPDFAPDYDCLFDTFQLKCIPGSEHLEMCSIKYRTDSDQKMMILSKPNNFILL